MSTSSDSSTESQSYDRLIQVAAGSITAVASALGVLGVGGGVAISLLRNSPEATLTGVSLAAAAVLIGTGSAFTKSKAVLDHWRRVSGALLTLGCLFIAWTWFLVGRAYTTAAARSNFERWAWWGFVVTWILATVGLAFMAWPIRRSLEIRSALVVTALAAFGSTVLGLVVLAATVSRSSARPAVAVTIDLLEKPPGAISVSGNLTASGLSNDEGYELIVSLRDRENGNGNNVVLFQTVVGPGLDGNLSYSFKIATPGNNVERWLAVSARLSGGQIEAERASAACESVQKATSPPFGTTCAIIALPKLLPP